MDEQERQRSRAMSEVLKALAHPTRLWIVEELAAGERCVCEFVALAEVDFSTISRHLGQLKQAGVVADRRQGKQVYYRLLAPCLLDFLHCIEGVVQGEGSRLVSAGELSARRARARQVNGAELS